MSELNFLLSGYTTGEIIAILIASLLLVVAIARAAGFIWEKVKQHFDIENDKDRWKNTIANKIDSIGNTVLELKASISDIEKKAEERGERLSKVEKYVSENYAQQQELQEFSNKMQTMCTRVQARLQDDTRWAFKDAYNYYYLREHKIDANTLEALEKKYEHYKAAGGNSFVDNIMIKLRELPLVSDMSDEVENE